MRPFPFRDPDSDEGSLSGVPGTMELSTWHFAASGGRLEEIQQ